MVAAGMRRNHLLQPPKANGGLMRAPQPLAMTRKIFNCIVDDTALIAGVKRSTRDGIRKWVSQGAIRLFVPLHSMCADQAQPPPSLTAV